MYIKVHSLSQNASQYHALQRAMWANVDFFDPSICPKPCIQHSMEGMLSATEIPGTPENKSSIYIYFSSLDSSISREITLFGPTGIVASVGGSLGLFLGFSCLDAALTIVERVRDWLHVRGTLRGSTSPTT